MPREQSKKVKGRVPIGEYDKNIVRHWSRITEKRNLLGANVKMKHSQHLSLLVTELYFDWYFNRKAELVNEIAGRIANYNHEHPRNESSALEEFDPNKVAFWAASRARTREARYVLASKTRIWYNVHCQMITRRVTKRSPWVTNQARYLTKVNCALLRQACEDSPCRCRDNGIPESRHGKSAVPRRDFDKSSEPKGISRL